MEGSVSPARAGQQSLRAEMAARAQAVQAATEEVIQRSRRTLADSEERLQRIRNRLNGNRPGLSNATGPDRVTEHDTGLAAG